MKPGFSYGQTDEYGFYGVADKMHVNDLHATLLALMGLDHEKLTFLHNGRRYRLTDVHGKVIKTVLACGGTPPQQNFDGDLGLSTCRRYPSAVVKADRAALRPRGE